MNIRCDTPYFKLTHYSRLQVHEDSPGNVLSSACLAEEGVEGIITSSNGLVRWHLTVWLDAVLQAVQFPACIADLHTSLPDVNRDALTLQKKEKKEMKKALCI